MAEVIKRAKGGKFIGWYIRYYDAEGKRCIRASKQPTYALARRMLLEIEGKIARGKAGMDEPAAKLTVDELCTRFLASSHPHVKDASKYRRGANASLQWILPLIGSGCVGRDVDLPRKRLTVARSFDALPKNGKPRTLPIPTALSADLSDWKSLSTVLLRRERSLRISRRSSCSSHAIVSMCALARRDAQVAARTDARHGQSARPRAPI